MNPNTAILIPAYEPGAAMLPLIRTLRESFPGLIIVIDDGSGPAYRDQFRKAAQLNCTVLTHGKNFGKGMAIRTGLSYINTVFPQILSVITCDADGQHLPEDILHLCDEAGKEEPATARVLLGTRDLAAAGVPLRSRFGNTFSSIYFRFTTGVRCHDTQTGLRAIPRRLFPLALETPGDRYEYEMNFLTAVASQLRYVPIQTVYEDGNTSSHFDTIKDSIRIYRSFFRYITASLLSAVVDLGIFTLLIMIFGRESILTLFGLSVGMIATATVTARLLSGGFNFLLNRHWSFADGRAAEGAPAGQALRYGILFVCIMLSSSALVSMLSILPAALPLIKAFVDTALSLVSYLVQKVWVFAPATTRQTNSEHLTNDTNSLSSVRKEAIHEEQISKSSFRS